MSRFERLVLMLVAATELDPSMASRCAQANGNPGAAYPTLALALSILPEASWDIVSRERPLRYWQLVELDDPRTEALTATRLRIDARIVELHQGAERRRRTTPHGGQAARPRARGDAASHATRPP